MNTIIFREGRLYRNDAALISPADSGFLFGEGVFETMRADYGRIFLLPQHLERLVRGLKLLEIPEPEPLGQIPDLCHELIQAGNLEQGVAVIKLAVSSGSPGSTPTLLLQARALDPNLISQRQAGMRAGLVSWRRDAANPLLAIKSLNFLENRHALRTMRARGLDEGIFLNQAGELCEGTFSNLFLVSGNTILTPPESAGLLPGITRAFLLENCRRIGLEIREQKLRPADLENCDGAFLSSSLMDTAPLLQLEQARFQLLKTTGLLEKLRQLFAAA
ncbi:MAG: aminotransferase class IV, partial [Deltaproteobacteria bacterium]|nr:aminotransferase class IV [Deltaproteobacteria bacterium]